MLKGKTKWIEMEQQKEADNNVKPIRKEILNPGNKYIELTPGTRVSRTHTHTHTHARCNPRGNSCAAAHAIPAGN